MFGDMTKLVLLIVSLAISPFILVGTAYASSCDMSSLEINNLMYYDKGYAVMSTSSTFISLINHNPDDESTLMIEISPYGSWSNTVKYEYPNALNIIEIENSKETGIYKLSYYNKCRSGLTSDYSVIYFSVGDLHPSVPYNFKLVESKYYEFSPIRLSWESDGNYEYLVEYSLNGSAWTYVDKVSGKTILFTPRKKGLYKWKIQAINGPYISDPLISESINVLGKYDDKPIIFVHGWSGLSFEDSGLCDSPDPDAYFERLDNDFIKAGFKVFYARLNTSPCFTPSLYINSRILKLTIEKVKHTTGASKVVLIAHSMGGLVARSYVEGIGYDDDVSILITLGAPHLGIPLDVFTSAYQLPLGILCVTQPAVCEMTINGMHKFNELYKTNKNVNYHLISGNTNDLNSMGTLVSTILSSPNDGLVSTLSGTGISNVDLYTTFENHKNLGPNDYFSRNDGLSVSNAFAKCLKPLLIDGTITNCGSVQSSISGYVDTSIYPDNFFTSDNNIIISINGNYILNDADNSLAFNLNTLSDFEGNRNVLLKFDAINNLGQVIGTYEHIIEVSYEVISNKVYIKNIKSDDFSHISNLKIYDLYSTLEQINTEVVDMANVLKEVKNYVSKTVKVKNLFFQL